MKTMGSVKKIVFFSSPSEVDEYIKNNKSTLFSTDKELFIAMTPAVNSRLRQNKIRAQNTLNYFTNESHMELLEKSKVLVEWLRKKSDFVNLGMDVQRAFKDSFIFWTRMAVHYCLWVIEVVSNAVDIHQPEILSTSLSRKKVISSLKVGSEERYLGYIVKIIARKRNLKFENTSTDTTSGDNLPISRLENYVYPIIKFILKKGRFQLWEKMISVRNIFVKNRPVFFTTRFYQMDRLAKEIQEQSADRQFYFLPGSVISSFKIPDFIIKLFWRKYSKLVIAQKRLFKNLETAISKETRLFSYKGISFNQVISQKIQDNIADYLIGLILWSIKLNQFINRSKASAFISNGSRLDDVLLTELCQQKNIPAILISHGSHVRPKNEYECIEWGEHGRALLRAPYAFVTLQSSLSEEYLEVFPSEGKAIKTGPLIWGRPVNVETSKLLFKKMFNGRGSFNDVKIILHAGTPKPGNSLRLYVYETPDEYIQALCELANTVEKIPNTFLIIRFRPSSAGISLRDLQTLVPFSEKVILNFDGSFIDVLGMADLLVSFSSTTIEEALQNRIPVLLYGGNGRYQHVPAYEIKPDNSIDASAVYHVKEAKDLEYAINNVLELNKDGKRVKHLFDPYIYHQNVRTPIIDLLNNCHEGVSP